MARLTYTQYASFLNDIYDQVTGSEGISGLSFGDYVDVFTNDKTINQDNLYGILDARIQRDIFAVRPYSRKMKGLEWDAERYGDITRKMTPSTVDDIDNPEWTIAAELAKNNPDFACCTAPVLQDFLALTIQGGNTYSRKYTIFRDQMNAAFRSPEGVASFFNMLITERQNRHELDFDSQKRNLICNYIIALAYEGGYRTFHALTEYNDDTDQELTATDILQADNFRGFMIWLSARIDHLRDMLTEKTSLYINHVSGKEITRFTPYNKQRVYLASEFAAYFDANKANIYHPDRLTDFGDYERVAYWQSPKDIFTVTGSAKTLDTDGGTETIDSTTVNGVIGFICDVDAIGISNISMWSAPEPYNARFGYQNTWYHDTFRHVTDMTENGILILMD